MLKPAFQEACRAACEALARETADGGPARAGRHCPGSRTASSTTPTRCSTAAASRRCASRSTCRITACSTKSACSRRARAGADRASAACASACRSARTSGGPDPVECIAETGGEILLVPNGSPYWRDKTDDAPQRRGRARHRERPAAHLSQPGRRPGRTRVRRRLVRAQRRPFARRPAAGLRRHGRATTVWERGAKRLALRRGADGGGRAGRRGRLRRLRAGPARLCRQEPLSRRRARAFPAASIRRCARRWRSMRWARARALRDAALSLHLAGIAATTPRRCAQRARRPLRHRADRRAGRGRRARAGAALRRPRRATSPRRTSRAARAA